MKSVSLIFPIHGSLLFALHSELVTYLLWPGDKCICFGAGRSRAALHNWWAAKLLQVGREMFRDNLNIFWKKLLVDTNCIFLEKFMVYESQKCIIVAFHPRNAPISLDCYCGFHKPKASAVTTCYICKDVSERFPLFSCFTVLCDLLIGAKVGRDIEKVEKHWSRVRGLNKSSESGTAWCTWAAGTTQKITILVKWYQTVAYWEGEKIRISLAGELKVKTEIPCSLYFGFIIILDFSRLFCLTFIFSGGLRYSYSHPHPD